MKTVQGALALAGLLTLVSLGTSSARAQGYGYGPGGGLYGGYQSVTTTSVVLAPAPIVVPQPVVVAQPVVVPRPVVVARPYYGGIDLTGVRPAWLLRGEEPRYECGKPSELSS